jgi:predicted MFS family arabinose efflux permease
VILVTHSSGRARHQWLGYLNTTSTLSSLFYMPIVGYIGHFGWHWPFLTYAIAAPVFFLALIGIAPDTPRIAAISTPAEAIASNSGGFVLGTPLAFIVFALASGTVLVTPMLYIPFRLRDMGITDPAIISMLLISGSITGALGAFTYGALRTRLSLSGTFVLTFLVMAAGLLLTATAEVKAQVVVGQILVGYSLGISMPNLYALASITGADAYRARTIGFTKMGIYGGPMLGQILLEPVIAHTSAKVVLCLISGAAVALALLSVWRTRGEMANATSGAA